MEWIWNKSNKFCSFNSFWETRENSHLTQIYCLYKMKQIQWLLYESKHSDWLREITLLSNLNRALSSCAEAALLSNVHLAASGLSQIKAESQSKCAQNLVIMELPDDVSKLVAIGCVWIEVCILIRRWNCSLILLCRFRHLCNIAQLTSLL